MPDINFLTIFHDYEDKDTLTKMADEICELYGFPCILRRWTGIQTTLDPLYQDLNSTSEQNTDLFEEIETFIYVDYKRFNEILHSYGLSSEDNQTTEAMMKLCDNPKEDDIIDILYPWDNKTYTFKIGSTDIHKDICYHVTINMYNRDFLKER